MIVLSNKRYYWLKLKEDFFEEDTINWIEEQENGKDYVLFYLKLCLKSLKTEGILIRNVGDMLVPYDVKKLAEITNTDFDTAAVAMELFKKIGLIEILENGEIFMTQLSEMVGSETNKAALMRRKRALDRQKKQLKDGNNVTNELPERYTEIEREKELDIDIDKEGDKEIEEETKKPPAPYEEIKSLYNSICKDLSKVRSISSTRKKHLKARWKQFDYDLEAFKEAFEKVQASDFCKGQNKRGWKVDFDWLIKNDNNIVKVLEGKYDNEDGGGLDGDGSAGSDSEKDIKFDKSKFLYNGED